MNSASGVQTQISQEGKFPCENFEIEVLRNSAHRILWNLESVYFISNKFTKFTCG